MIIAEGAWKIFLAVGRGDWACCTKAGRAPEHAQKRSPKRYGLLLGRIIVTHQFFLITLELNVIHLLNWLQYKMNSTNKSLLTFHALLIADTPLWRGDDIIPNLVTSTRINPNIFFFFFFFLKQHWALLVHLHTEGSNTRIWQIYGRVQFGSPNAHHQPGILKPIVSSTMIAIHSSGRRDQRIGPPRVV